MQVVTTSGIVMSWYGTNVNTIYRPTPAWFPDSLIRSLDKSLYTKMLNSSAYISSEIERGGLVLDFYNDSGGFLASMWNSAVNSLFQ